MINVSSSSDASLVFLVSRLSRLDHTAGQYTFFVLEYVFVCNRA